MLICVINSIPKLLASLILEVNEFVNIGIIFFLRGSIYLHILVTAKLSDERLIRAHVYNPTRHKILSQTVCCNTICTCLKRFARQ